MRRVALGIAIALLVGGIGGEHLLAAHIHGGGAAPYTAGWLATVAVWLCLRLAVLAGMACVIGGVAAAWVVPSRPGAPTAGSAPTPR